MMIGWIQLDRICFDQKQNHVRGTESSFVIVTTAIYIDVSRLPTSHKTEHHSVCWVDSSVTFFIRDSEIPGYMRTLEFVVKTQPHILRHTHSMMVVVQKDTSNFELLSYGCVVEIFYTGLRSAGQAVWFVNAVS
jgi:hypothetical protein